MFATIVDVILLIALVYLIAGLIFALLFAFKLLDEFDEDARNSPLLFRLLIIPASALLWIYLLKKVLQKRKA